MENIYKSPNSTILDIEDDELAVKRSTRFLNLVLDMVLFLPVCACIIGPFNFLAPTEWVEGFWSFYLNEKNVSLSGLFTLVIYYSVFESINGKSPAKYITKTKVVSKSGKKANVLQVFVRSFTRIFYFEAITFILGKNCQYGLHDLISRTKVIKQK